MKATHAKRVFANVSLSTVLHELAEFCEGHAVDGPIVVDFDRSMLAHKATVFYMPFASEIGPDVILYTGAQVEPLYQAAEPVA